MKRALLLLALLAVSLAAAGQIANRSATILPSAARTAATVNSADQTNDVYHRAHVIVNVSAYTSGNYTPKLQGKDPVSGNYYDLLTGTAMSGTGTQVLKIGPGLAASANAAAADVLPRVWRVQLGGAATPSMTLSVSAFLAE